MQGRLIGRETEAPVRGGTVHLIAADSQMPQVRAMAQQELMQIRAHWSRDDIPQHANNADRALLSGDSVAGVVLADQVKNLDWSARRVAFRERVPESVLEEVLEKLAVLIG